LFTLCLEIKTLNKRPL